MKTDCEGKKDPTEVLESPQIAEPFILMLSWADYVLLAALLVLSPCLDNKRNPGAERQSDTKFPLEDSFQYVKQLKWTEQK